MKPDLSFLARIRSTLEGLFGGGDQPAKPLKVVQPQGQVAGAQSPAPTEQPFRKAAEHNVDTGVSRYWPETQPTQMQQAPTQMPQQMQAQIPTASPTPFPRITAEQVLAGLAARANGGAMPPIASNASALAQLGNSLPMNIDPFFPAALALRESGGGVTSGVPENNPFGLMSWDQQGNRALAQYPDLQTAILGGGPQGQRGLAGTLKGGLYNKFLESGQMADFLNTYSPPGENATVEDQAALLNELLQYFRQPRS